MGSLLFPKKNWVDEEGVTFHTAADRYAVTNSLLTTPNLPASSVANRDLSDQFRVLSLARSRTFLEINLGAVRACDVVCLAGTNLSPSAQIRVLTMVSGANRFVEYVQPDGVGSLVNMTGAHTDVDDDPREADANNFAATTDGTEASGLFTFASPPANLKTGANNQIFEVLSGCLSDLAMSLRLQLYESASQVGSVQVDDDINAILGQGGEITELEWDAADLAAVSGANVELNYIGNPGSSDVSTPVPMAIGWFAMLDNDDTDSGWQYAFPSAVRNDASADWPFGRAVFVRLPASTTAQQIRIEIDDPSNPYGFIDMGRVIVSEGIEPAVDAALGSRELSIADASTVQVLADGQTYVETGAKKRVHLLRYDQLTAAEAQELSDYLDGRQGLGGEVGLIWDATSGEFGYNAVYGRIPQSFPARLVTNNESREFWSKTFQVEEIVSI